jgi:hypothetical protein
MMQLAAAAAAAEEKITLGRRKRDSRAAARMAIAQRGKCKCLMGSLVVEGVC